MKEITIEKKGFEDKCPICKKTIQAYSKSQMEYNMKLHKEKCKKNDVQPKT